LRQAQDFHHTLQEIGKSDLLQSASMYDSVTQSLGTLIQRVDEFNRDPMMTNAVLYDNLNGSLKELRESMKDFRSNPRKFMWMKLF
jgi:phospholipid/cholesterol/gamma-HCH transport system substrate-binding protein